MEKLNITKMMMLIWMSDKTINDKYKSRTFVKSYKFYHKKVKMKKSCI